tara:strand:+ start:6 stop:1565 length:1560 start_codon:yes stop_codon:yes gene_type:complete
MNSDDLARISLLSFVGSFSLIVILHNTNDLFALVSCTCPNPYVFAKGNRIFIEFDENKLLKDYADRLSLKSIINISLSHQLVVRYPTQLFDLSKIIRCPSGHITHLSNTFSRVNFYSYLNNFQHAFSSSRLRNSLVSILSLYHQKYGSDLGLLFSGGLDSSCLASTLKSSNIPLPFFHIDYKGDISLRSCVAAYISSFFESPTRHIPRFSNAVQADEVLRQCRAGLMTVPNPMYFGVPINSTSVEHLPKYLITGQGADSIYVIDGFAPPTESIGTQRINQILRSAPDRLALCESYIFKQLDYHNPIIDSSLLSSSTFTDFVNKQCCDLLEHVDYKEYTPNLKKTFVTRERLDLIAKPVLSLLQSYIQSSNSSVSISSVYRYIKWMRSLINCPQQDASALLSQSVQRLTPYLEGPIVGLFFGYKLREMESISIKHELESLFEYQSGVSHRRLVEVAITQTPSPVNCGEKIYTSASKKYVENVQSQVLESLINDYKSSPRYHSLSDYIQDITQLVRIAPFI